MSTSLNAGSNNCSSRQTGATVTANRGQGISAQVRSAHRIPTSTAHRVNQRAPPRSEPKVGRRQVETRAGLLDQWPRKDSSGEHPYGLKILHESKNTPGKIPVDIVFVHGPYGHRLNSWTKQDKVDCWPDRFLAEDIPQARVMTFGYINDDFLACQPKHVSRRNFDGHARNLLADLTSLRKKTQSERRSIIFIPHWMGGQIVEQAICMSESSRQDELKQVSRYTSGVAFMGTARGWIQRFGLADSIETLSKVVLNPRAEQNLTFTLIIEVLAETDELFAAWVAKKPRSGNRRFNACSFSYETQEGIWAMAPVTSSDCAVWPLLMNPANSEKKTLADMTKLEGFPQHSIAANLEDMVRFSSKEDAGYATLIAELKGWCRRTCEG